MEKNDYERIIKAWETIIKGFYGIMAEAEGLSKDWEKGRKHDKDIRKFEENIKHVKDSIEGLGDAFTRMDMEKMKVCLPEEMTRNIRQSAEKLGNALRPVAGILDELWERWPGRNNDKGET